MIFLQILALINTLVFAPLTVIQVLIGFIIYLLGLIFRSKSIKTHGKQLALAADQNMNVIWLGDPDETISSRIGRAILSGRPKWYIKFFLRPFVDMMAKLFGDFDHCINAVEKDENMDEKYQVWKWYR
jgi:hypothetical protein